MADPQQPQPEQAKKKWWTWRAAAVALLGLVFLTLLVSFFLRPSMSNVKEEVAQMKEELTKDYDGKLVAMKKAITADQDEKRGAAFTNFWDTVRKNDLDGAVKKALMETPCAKACPVEKAPKRVHAAKSAPTPKQHAAPLLGSERALRCDFRVKDRGATEFRVVATKMVKDEHSCKEWTDEQARAIGATVFVKKAY